MGFAASERVSHRGEELGVFSGTADRDADRFGETHPAERTNDDAFEEQFIAERFGGRADGDKEEIGFAGDGREAESAESFVQAVPLLAIDFDGATDVFGVVESSGCGRLRAAASRRWKLASWRRLGRSPCKSRNAVSAFGWGLPPQGSM